LERSSKKGDKGLIVERKRGKTVPKVTIHYFHALYKMKYAPPIGIVMQ